MNELEKTSAIQAYKEQEKNTQKNKIKKHEGTLHFTEVSYKNGQLRATIEPIPNKYGEMHILCLNPEEAYAIIQMKKRGTYQLPKEAL